MKNSNHSNNRKKLTNASQNLRKKKRHPVKQTKMTNATMAVITGNWIEAVGAVVTAIVSTPSNVFTEQTRNDFNLIGNILEAGGTAIAAEGETDLLNIVGEQLQSIGNIAVVAGILSKNKQTAELLQKQGDLLQVLGIGMTIQTSGPLTLVETIANSGNVIQLIGGVMQIFADTTTEEGISINAIGAWINAIGSVITALATE